MMVETDFDPEAKGAAPASLIGVLPDAPLAMPKQRLDRTAPVGRGLWTALLRPFFARTGRSEG